MQQVVVEDFEAVRNPNISNLVLVDCTVNGEESGAICVMKRNDDGTVDLTPIFVAVTLGMKVVDTEGRQTGPGSVEK